MHTHRIIIISILMTVVAAVGCAATAAVPRAEYPRPQFERTEWQCLNGPWTYQFDFGQSGVEQRLFESKGFKDEITVPFCPESPLSGVGRKDFIPAIWYHRTLDVPAAWAGRRLLLHFGGVDYRAQIYIDGRQVAEHYGVEMRETLTGFKWIGDQIAALEADGEVERFIFGFEESYGYLAGPYVRDKDAVIASMLICEMAAYYRSIGSSIKQRLEEIYAEYGRYLNQVDSFEFPGLSGMDKMAGMMASLREEPPKDIAGIPVAKVTDYLKPEETGLPKSNVLTYSLENGETVVVRPSGTEPKIKAYYTTKGADLAEAQAHKDKLAEALAPIFA